MTNEPLERIIEPGCAMIKLARSHSKQYPECFRCDGHKTSCKNYIEKSQVKPENVVNTSEIAYSC